MPTTSHLPDQPIMKYVHPADRLRPWFGVALSLAALGGMLAFGILGRNFGTPDHLKALNDAGGWLTMSLIEASAGILALLLAAVALGERIERGVEGPHFVSLIRLTARGGFATIAPAVLFDVLKVTTTSVVQQSWVITALVGKKERSKSLHRPTLPTIWSTSTTLVPRWRRLPAARRPLLTSSKESNRFEPCSLRIRATAARRRARRLARVKSASTCSFRFMYGIIFSSLLKTCLRNRFTK
jgi:hypothetical protein